MGGGEEVPGKKQESTQGWWQCGRATGGGGAVTVAHGRQEEHAKVNGCACTHGHATVRSARRTVHSAQHTGHGLQRKAHSTVPQTLRGTRHSPQRTGEQHTVPSPQSPAHTTIVRTKSWSPRQGWTGRGTHAGDAGVEVPLALLATRGLDPPLTCHTSPESPVSPHSHTSTHQAHVKAIHSHEAVAFKRKKRFT